MIVSRLRFVTALLTLALLPRSWQTGSAAVILAAACFTSGCPMLVEDEFKVGNPSTGSRAGEGGDAQAGAETSGAGAPSLGGNLNAGAAGHPSVEGGAAGGPPTSAEGGAAAEAGDTNGGGPPAGSEGTCDDGRRSAGETDRDCG